MEDGTIENHGLIRRPRQLDEDERDDEKRQRVVISSNNHINDDNNNNNNTNNNSGGGGILDNLMLQLSSPRTPKPIDVEMFDANTLADDEFPGSGGGGGGSDGGGGGCGGSGGVLDNLMSRFFNQNEEKLEGSEKGNKDEEETQEASIGSGNIITNLVPDEVFPASDEASILIHSVVHD